MHLWSVDNEMAVSSALSSPVALSPYAYMHTYMVHAYIYGACIHIWCMHTYMRHEYTYAYALFACMATKVTCTLALPLHAAVIYATVVLAEPMS